MVEKPASFKWFLCIPVIVFVNPLIITGILTMAIAVTAMMLSFSTQQVQYSKTVEQASTLQAQRLAEDLEATMNGKQIQIKNTGSNSIQIKEIRILDDTGRVIITQKVDDKILSAQSSMAGLNPDLEAILDSVVIQKRIV